MKPYKIALLLSYICVASFSATLITPALPVLSHFFSVGTAALSWVISIFLIGYVIGQLIYGPLAKKYGSLNALRFGLILNCVGILVSLGSITLVSFHVLLLGRLLTALGAASGLACTFMLMHDLLTGSEYKHAMSFTALAFTLGIGVAVLLGGLITQYLHWQVCFWILLGHGVIMLLLTWVFSQNKDHNSVQALHWLVIAKNYWAALCNTQLIIFSLVVGLVSSFSYVYATVAPMYVHTNLHMNPAVYGYWNCINMVGMFFGGFMGGKLMKKHGAKKLLGWGLMGFLPCSLVLVFIAVLSAKVAILFFVTTALMYFFGGFLFPSGSYFAMASVSDKANGSSMMSFINMLTAVLSVIVVSYLPLKPIAAFSLLMCILYIFIICLIGMKKKLQ
jgi:MFS family permease